MKPIPYDLSLSLSKDTVNKVVFLVSNDQAYFPALFSLFTEGTLIEKRNAIWALRPVFEQNPELISSDVKFTFIESLKKNEHPAIPRGIWAVLTYVEVSLDEDQTGELTELAFKAISKSNTPVAIKAHAMSFLEKVVHVYPELKLELKELLTSQFDFASAGFKSRANKILKKL